MSPNFFHLESNLNALQFWVFLVLTSCWAVISFVLCFYVVEKVFFTGNSTFLPESLNLIIQLWNQPAATEHTAHGSIINTVWVDLRLRMPSVNGIPGRVAIVTGGATVVFKELLDEVATPKFLRALSDAGFEQVLIQCGSYKNELHERLVKIQNEYLHIELVDFVSNMKERMELCRGLAGVRPGGVVFSHAGTGTIADCWEAKVANVIVANPNLMDNHQLAFAEEMAKQHETVILAHLGHLDEAIPETMAVIQAQGLDDLGTPLEPTFPLPDDVRLGFIDNLFEI